MAEHKTSSAPTPSIFSKQNYMWMLAGLALIAIGMFLMAGGKSDNPAVFNEGEVYSKTRITVAPLLILGGLVLEIFAIFRNKKS